MDLQIIEENEIVSTRRKKKNRESKGSLFRTYKSEKTMKDYMFHLKDFLSFVFEGDKNFSEDELLAYRTNG